MFRGISSVNMDAKGRLALPTRYRDSLMSRCAGHIVVTIDVRERCLLLYPLQDWEAVQAQLEAMANMRSSARVVQRMLIGHASDVELDANGRLLVPPMLREFAGLTKKTVLSGQGNKIEIWSESLWHEGMSTWRSPDVISALDDGEQFDGLSI